MIERICRETRGLAKLPSQAAKKVLEIAGFSHDPNSAVISFSGRIALIGDSCASPEIARKTISELSAKSIITEGVNVHLRPVLPTVSYPPIRTYSMASRAAERMSELLNDSLDQGEVFIEEETRLSPDWAESHPLAELVNGDTEANDSHLLIVQPFYAQRVFNEGKANAEFYKQLRSGGAVILGAGNLGATALQSEWVALDKFNQQS